MFRSKLILVTTLLLSMTSVKADNRNAATWYNRAFETMSRRLTTDDINYLGDYAASYDVIPPPTPELRAIVAKARFALEYARRGARQGHADFGLDYSQGFDLQLPHLIQMRYLEQLMRADALIRMADGDADGAVETMSSSYRMAGHLGEDGTLISSLVASVIFKHADGGIQYAIDHGQLDASQQASLLDAIADLPPGDPFSVVDAVAMEQSVVIDWLSVRFDEAESPEAFADSIAASLGDETLAGELADLTEDEFVESLDQYDRMMDEVVEAFAIDDPELARGMLESISAEVGAGEHGALAKMVGDVFLRVFEKWREMNKMVADRATMLEDLLSGQRSIDEEANAVAFYLRAIAMLDAVDDVQPLRDLDPLSTEAIDDRLQTLLIEAQPIVETIREGSLKKRCDFTYTRFLAQPILAQAYAPGMRDLYRLLHADAIRLLRAGEIDPAIERLQTAYRLTGHLGLDETLVTSLVADRGYHLTLELTVRLQKSGELTPERQSSLYEGLRRIGRADPFGYLASMRKERAGLVGSVLVARVGTVIEEGQRAALTATVAQWSGDQVIYLLAVLDTMVRADPSHSPRAPEVAVERLDDVLAPAALQATRSQVPDVAPKLLEKDPTPFDGRELPNIADVDKRPGGARAALRRGYALLRPTRTPKSEPAVESPTAP
ncbi:MAG: hypothetical protein ACYTGC_00205 [Planctomycetota bacterium]